jgi:hypothetical protein
MELNSVDDVKALAKSQKELQKIKKTQSLEKKIRQSGYFPVITLLAIVVLLIWRIYSGNFDITIADLFFVGIIIGGSCFANVKRMDLIRELMELKYGK